jgi:hypothetical protein
MIRVAREIPKSESAESTAAMKFLGAIRVRATLRPPASAWKKEVVDLQMRKTAHGALKHSEETRVVKGTANSTNGHVRCTGSVFSESISAESTGSIELHEAIQVRTIAGPPLSALEGRGGKPMN